MIDYVQWIAGVQGGPEQEVVQLSSEKGDHPVWGHHPAPKWSLREEKKTIQADQCLERIKEKLNRLRQQDHPYRVFGARKHRYHLMRCLSLEQIHTLEQRSHLSLPEDYRLFLQVIGNGGAGPSSGILPLEKSLKLGKSLAWTAGDNPGPVDYFERPFVPPTSVKSQEDWETLLSLTGLLPITSLGDGGYVHLVVSGKERGYLWGTHDGTNWLWPEFSTRDVIPEDVWSQHGKSDFINFLLSPLHTHRVTFLEWYEHWLDEPIIVSK